jgi:carbon monoxide dehydrogenase subunit G
MAENDLETRVERLEADLTSIKVDLGVIKATMATRTDIAELRAETKATIAEAKNSIILWVVSVVILAQLLPSLLKSFG